MSRLRLTPRERLRRLALIFKGFNDMTLEKLDEQDPGTVLSLLELYEGMMRATRESALGRAWGERALEKGSN